MNNIIYQLYIIMSFHFIFFSWNDIEFIRKPKFTLSYTFYMAGAKSNDTIMAVDDLRRDGIGDILVDTGRMTEDQKMKLLEKYSEEDERYEEESSQ